MPPYILYIYYFLNILYILFIYYFFHFMYFIFFYHKTCIGSNWRLVMKVKKNNVYN